MTEIFFLFCLFWIAEGLPREVREVVWDAAAGPVGVVGTALGVAVLLRVVPVEGELRKKEQHTNICHIKYII